MASDRVPVHDVRLTSVDRTSVQKTGIERRLRRRRAGELVDVFHGERTATRGGPRVHRPADRERHDWRATLRTPRQARSSRVALPVVARPILAIVATAAAVRRRVTVTTITSAATRRLIGHVGHPTTTPIVGDGSDTDPGREAGENGRYDRRARGLCLAGGYAFMASDLPRLEATVSGALSPGAFLMPALWHVETDRLPAISMGYCYLYLTRSGVINYLT